MTPICVFRCPLGAILNSKKVPGGGDTRVTAAGYRFIAAASTRQG